MNTMDPTETRPTPRHPKSGPPPRGNDRGYPPRDTGSHNRDTHRDGNSAHESSYPRRESRDTDRDYSSARRASPRESQGRDYPRRYQDNNSVTVDTRPPDAYAPPRPRGRLGTDSPVDNDNGRKRALDGNVSFICFCLVMLNDLQR